MRRAKNILCFLTLIWCLPNNGLYSQVLAQNTFGEIPERLLIESRWEYTYTLHLESNTIVHQADEQYEYFLYFRYNYAYQEFLNGDFKKGWWSLDGRTLEYQHQNNDQFEIANLNKKILILEFTRTNSTGTYQYHFVRVKPNETPFIKPANELPDVLVEDFVSQKKQKIAKEKRGWFSFLKRKKKTAPEAPPPVYINIELVGGGYYGGIDPVLKDIIHIKSTGRLIKEFQSKHQGTVITKKDIPREELEQFAEYIEKQQFFEFERSYDCESRECFKRKTIEPKPIPMRLAITYGDRSKIVMLGIWGKDEYGIQYLDYPPALDNIIDAIQRMANRLESPVARK